MEIHNTQDIIDSRDVIARIEELESEKLELEEALNELVKGWGEVEDKEEAAENLNDWVEDYGGELKALQSLAEEGNSCAADWNHGEGLIHENYFTEFSRQREDIGELPFQDLPWYIENHIDWEGVAEEIKQDYTEVDFDGETYYIR